MLARDLTELVGHTPTLILDRFCRASGVRAEIFAKLESFNPAGSVKDRAALKMIESAETEGRLAPGAVIVEPTSGNTGIGLAAIGAAKGYRVILTMPESMSVERRQLLLAYGAELVLTPAKDGMSGAVRRAEEIASSFPNAWIAGQFDNPANPLAHYLTTGEELLEDTNGALDWFVAGVGTGGTLSGTARRLRERIPGLKVAAVEPASSPLLSEGRAGAHKLQGIGANFVPQNLDRTAYDEIVTVTDEAAYAVCKLLVKTEGILVGISSGAAIAAATELARRPENAGKRFAVICPDGGEKYLSAGVF